MFVGRRQGPSPNSRETIVTQFQPRTGTSTDNTRAMNETARRFINAELCKRLGHRLREFGRRITQPKAMACCFAEIETKVNG